MTTGKFGLILAASAALGLSATAPAFAQDSIYVPLLTYRTGPFAGSGIPIAAGGDLGNRYPHGTNAREIEFLVRAGLTALDALRAATPATSSFIVMRSSIVIAGIPAERGKIGQATKRPAACRLR